MSVFDLKNSRFLVSFEIERLHDSCLRANSPLSVQQITEQQTTRREHIGWRVKSDRMHESAVDFTNFVDEVMILFER